MVGGASINYNKDLPSEAFLLTTEDLFQCGVKENAVKHTYGNFGGDVYGQPLACGGEADGGQEKDECYTYNYADDSLELTDVILPFPVRHGRGVTLPDGRWWVTGGEFNK